ncbi:hypothetical protein VHEMI03138 [[Torrubiella] hemipterigena]|uniref:non-specific serine/threonine protein kinase n=1 Tax=[Torrubiella] hemipterigena TaxID=1531966 RepID=A0A0A1SXR2_9HYPO|nr:hypothetical protein VHEMI03138 [[Torrubiella] hemipterigena]
MSTKELEDLRRLIAEERRLREEEQRLREEEQRLREEEQRRREAAEQSLRAEEQRRRDEEENRRAEDLRRREEEENRRVEALRRREEEEHRLAVAEELARESRPQTLEQYLGATHELDLSIQVVTDPSSTTKGDATNPAGRIYPRRIVPWHDFAAKQEEVWERLSTSPQFYSEAAFPSKHQLAYVQSILQPISSEIGLRNFERDVVENAVQKLVERSYKDPVLRENLGLQGTVAFESHTNLTAPNNTLSESLEQMSIGDSVAPAGPSTSRTKYRQQTTRRRARGKGNRADQFCIYRTSDGRNIPVLAIEYKAPHKVGIDEIVTGLESEIQPDRDVINQDVDSFASSSRALSAAVVTQLFSYMVGKGIPYGYFCTGQILGFLHIGDDPATVQVALRVPALDVVDSDENGLHFTATAQVFAFLLQAMAADPPPESWHDAADKLDTWVVEYDDILSKIPISAKKKERHAPSYRPQRWKGFKRSPIQTRSRCKRSNPALSHSESDDDPPSPTPDPSTKTNQQVTPDGTARASDKTKHGSGNHSNQQVQQHQRQLQTNAVNIKDRLFCTHKCLLGLANGGPLDPACPNLPTHGQHHIKQAEFIERIRTQLRTDRGHNADCMCLYLSGRRGVLFKVTLSSHGYTMVAKGMESFDQHFLLHEKSIYDRLRPIQGRSVPVCVGIVDLVLPNHFDGGVYSQFLFLSWAGEPLPKCVNATQEVSLVGGVKAALKAIHRLRVLHRDVAGRNILYDANGNVMVIDFEGSEVRDKQPLEQLSLNILRQKRCYQDKKERDEFARELQAALDLITSRAMTSNLTGTSLRVMEDNVTKETLLNINRASRPRRSRMRQIGSYFDDEMVRLKAQHTADRASTYRNQVR